jgi:hypothetical protein
MAVGCEALTRRSRGTRRKHVMENVRRNTCGVTAMLAAEKNRLVRRLGDAVSFFLFATPHSLSQLDKAWREPCQLGKD